MDYVKINADGSVKQFPYPLNQLVLDNPKTSFPETITDATAAAFNVFPVVATTPPAYDYTKNLNNTATLQKNIWTETWILTPATQHEIESRTNAKANEVRADRNGRLAACDWTQLPDAPVDHTVWASYRQSLRDVTDQPGFPWNITWPVEP